MRLVDDGWRILSNPGLGAPRRHFGLKTKSMDARGRLTARGQVTSVKGLNFLSSMITTRDRPNTKAAIAGMAHHDDGAAPMKSATTPEARRGGKECGSKFKYRLAPEP